MLPILLRSRPHKSMLEFVLFPWSQLISVHFNGASEVSKFKSVRVGYFSPAASAFDTRLGAFSNKVGRSATGFQLCFIPVLHAFNQGSC
jgi:hypothetical protein